MLKILFSLVFLSVTSWAHASTSDVCLSNSPWGLPQAFIRDSVLVCRMGLNLLHSNSARTAAWVSYTLDRERVLACAARVDQFDPDPAVPAHARSTTGDYRRSGFDMGHLAPNADQSWHPQVQRESFFLSNVAPQLPSLNRGLWRELETIVRSWAFARGNLTVYVGSVLEPNLGTIGANRVIVPSAFYKIVIDNRSRTTLAFLFPHRDGLGDHIRSVQTTVSHIQEIANIVFPIPDNPAVMQPLWPIDTRSLARARNDACARRQ